MHIPLSIHSIPCETMPESLDPVVAALSALPQPDEALPGALVGLSFWAAITNTNGLDLRAMQWLVRTDAGVAPVLPLDILDQGTPVPLALQRAMAMVASQSIPINIHGPLVDDWKRDRGLVRGKRGLWLLKGGAILGNTNCVYGDPPPAPSMDGWGLLLPTHHTTMHDALASAGRVRALKHTLLGWMAQHHTDMHEAAR